MRALLDDVSRILAGPSSRRQAFRLVGGALGGAALAFLGLGRASLGRGAPVGNSTASELGVTCPTGQKVCGSLCCGGTQYCCTTSAGYHQCCNTPCCYNSPGGQYCCDGKGPCCGLYTFRKFCCPLGSQCKYGECL
jgi:hypothetical protein